MIQLSVLCYNTERERGSESEWAARGIKVVRCDVVIKVLNWIKQDYNPV